MKLLRKLHVDFVAGARSPRALGASTNGACWHSPVSVPPTGGIADMGHTKLPHFSTHGRQYFLLQFLLHLSTFFWQAIFGHQKVQ